MSRTEIARRNLTSTISECLKEHEVELAGEEGVVPMSLIEVSAPSSLFQDFVDTYNGEVDEFKRKLAKQIMGEETSTQRYGVLVDGEMRYAFAFNRQFADIDRDAQRIAFRNVEEILLERSSGQDLSGVEAPLEKFLPDFENDRFSLGSTRLKYSLTGKKGSKNDGDSKGDISFEKASLLDRVHKEYSGNTVELGNKKFFLVTVPYETDTFTDFMRTYEGEVDEFKVKLAKQAFGDQKRENQYAFLFDDTLRVQFAFNTTFASYDSEAKTVNYKPAEEVLLEQTQGKDLSVDTPKPTFMPRRLRRRPGSTRMKYSLVGKD